MPPNFEPFPPLTPGEYIKLDQAGVAGVNKGFREAAQIIAELRRSIRRIEELATDTPTPEDAEKALDAIRSECERALSDT